MKKLSAESIAEVDTKGRNATMKTVHLAFHNFVRKI